MVFSMLLGLPKELPVIFDVRAIGVTFITYMVVFILLSFISALRIWNIKIIRLLKEFRTDKKREENIKVALFIRFCLFSGRVCVGATSDDDYDSNILFPCVYTCLFWNVLFFYTWSYPSVRNDKAK